MEVEDKKKKEHKSKEGKRERTVQGKGRENMRENMTLMMRRL